MGVLLVELGAYLSVPQHWTLVNGARPVIVASVRVAVEYGLRNGYIHAWRPLRFIYWRSWVLQVCWQLEPMVEADYPVQHLRFLASGQDRKESSGPSDMLNAKQRSRKPRARAPMVAEVNEFHNR